MITVGLILGVASAIAGIVIVSGYGTVSVTVAPNFHAIRSLTRVGGVFFFLSCAFSHLEYAGHYLAGEPITMTEFESWHMALIHIPQAAAVYVFIAGLYIEDRLPITRRGPQRVADVVLVRIGESAWLNRFCDRINRRLFSYATAYGSAVLTATILGI